MNEKIELLARQKEFSALSAQERKEVLTEMSEAEYKQWRNLFIAALQMEGDANPPAHLRTKLLAQMAQQPKRYGIPRLLSAKIPAWQAAAVFMLGLVAVSFLKNEVVVEKHITKWQLQVDTVFQEKTLWRDRIVLRNKVIYSEKAATQPMAYSPEKIDSQSFTPSFQSSDFPDTHIGTSLSETPELMDFFTQGDQ